VRFPHRSVAVAMILAAATACHSDATGPGYGLLAGTWTLSSVSGRGPISGGLILSPAGGAERRVRYGRDTGSPESVARGTYRLRSDGTIDLQLRENDGRSEYVWRPIARVTGGSVEIRHPDPADGPDIVETYRRM